MPTFENWKEDTSPSPSLPSYGGFYICMYTSFSNFTAKNERLDTAAIMPVFYSYYMLESIESIKAVHDALT